MSTTAQIIHGHRAAPSWRATCVAIGNFDGVHLGHQALVHRAAQLAAAHDAIPIVLTFDPHPSTLLQPTAAPAMLTSLARRCELLAAAGAQAIVVESFTRELAGFSPTAFVDDVLLYALRARAIIVGYDFTYGHGRAGTITALKAHGARTGVEVSIVNPVSAAGETASSSKIRAHLRAGEIADANRLLGRDYDLDGTVVHGAKRGRAIGIPTANIRPETDLALATGIYVCTLAIDGVDSPPLPAVASLGTNPTFVDQGGVVLEVHVLDWPPGHPEIYDRRVRTTFVSRLRGESKFDSVDALIAQIHRDIDDARAMFSASAAARPPPP